MTSKITGAFAFLLLAGASSAALAQDRDRGDRADHWQGAGQPVAPRPAQPAAPPRIEPQPRFERGGPPPGAVQPGVPAQPGVPGQPGAPARFDRGPGAPGPDRQSDHQRPHEVIHPAGDRSGRWAGGHGDGDHRDGDHRGGDHHDGDHRDGDHRGGDDHDGDHHDGDHRDGDHHDGGHHDGDHHDGDRRDGRNNPWRGGEHWQQGRYPSVFWSQDRFRIGGYRPPYGYYVRSWGFGDFLPRGWYGQDYWVGDFIDYDLPYPPPGYEWVRVAGDALLIDRYTGRVVQVVRGIFW